MGTLRHHPSIGKLPCVGADWRLSRPELDALIWREGGRSLRPGGAATARHANIDPTRSAPRSGAND